MTVQTQKVTEEDLREVFADTLGKGTSFSAIMLAYNDGGRLPRWIVGVPYDLRNGMLEVGPYLKSIVISPPSDYHEMKKQIPIKDIVQYHRMELSDIL